MIVSYSFVLTSEYATPQVRYSNSIHCYTKWPSSWLSWLKNDKWNLSLHMVSSYQTRCSLYRTHSVVQVWPDYACHAHTILAREAKKHTHENAKCLGTVLGHNSPLVAHTISSNKQECKRFSDQFLATINICILHILFELCLVRKKQRNKGRWTDWNFCVWLGLLDSVKG